MYYLYYGWRNDNETHKHEVIYKKAQNKQDLTKYCQLLKLLLDFIDKTIHNGKIK